MATVDAMQYLIIGGFAMFFLLFSAGNSRLFRVSNMFRRTELTWGFAALMFLGARTFLADSSAAALSIIFCVVLFGLMLHSIFPETPPAKGEWEAHPRWWPPVRNTACCMAGIGVAILLHLEIRTILASS